MKLFPPFTVRTYLFKSLIILGIFMLNTIPSWAQEEDEEQDSSRFFFGANISAYFTDQDAARLYTGRPSVTPFGIEYVFAQQFNRQAFINYFQDPDFKVAEYPFEPRYRTSVELGFHLGYHVNQDINLFLDFNFTQLDFEQFFTVEYRPPLSQSPEATLERIPILGEDVDRMGITTEEATGQYVFAVSQLSWINVDRFYKMTKENQRRLALSTDDANNEKALIIFKNIRSMLPCSPNEMGDGFELNRFPKKEEAYIFAYKVVNQRPMICFMPIDQSNYYRLEYTESSFFEIKEILAQFESS